jgi:pyrrolidone-carboxylate peptidase
MKVPQTNTVRIQIEASRDTCARDFVRVSLCNNTVHRVINPARERMATFHALPAGRTRVTVTRCGQIIGSKEIVIPAADVLTVVVATQDPPPSVLVTGFCDWESLEPEKNLWCCRVNTSGLLLLGKERTSTTPPTAEELGHGPLSKRLRARSDAKYHFKLLPTTWEVARSIPWASHDVVIGLGIDEELHCSIRVEVSAINFRDQIPDAAGKAPSDTTGEPIDPRRECSDSLTRPELVDASLRALVGRDMAGYQLALGTARSENAYICNETNYLSIAALQGHKKPCATMFLHTPKEDGEVAREALATAVESTIAAFLTELRERSVLPKVAPATDAKRP